VTVSGVEEASLDRNERIVVISVIVLAFASP